MLGNCHSAESKSSKVERCLIAGNSDNSDHIGPHEVTKKGGAKAIRRE